MQRGELRGPYTASEGTYPVMGNGKNWGKQVPPFRRNLVSFADLG